MKKGVYSMVRGKNILLGVSGGIAVYKACALTSKLTQKGANVKVIMTENATKFVSPLTFQALSRNPVYTDTFDEKELVEFIGKFISDLELKKRTIFLARYWYFYSIHDIARKLGYTESNVKTTLKRTRDKLFEELKKEGLI